MGRESRSGKGERTKAALADALAELLAEMPLSKIRIRAITDRAGVDRQTFYYHFDTLYDLAMYLYQLRFESELTTLPACANVREMFSLVADMVEKNRAMLAGMLAEQGRPAIRLLLHDDMKHILRDEAARRCADRGVDIPARRLDFAAEYCLVASASLFVDWLDGKVDGSAQDLAADLARAFEQHIEGVMACEDAAACEGATACE